jgi:AraC-like DNA-binding protein
MVMAKVQQLSVGWARLVFELLGREGLDATALFTQFNLDVSQLPNPSAFFKQDDFTLLWQEASRLTGNPAIGLTMGKQPTVSSFDAYSFSLMSCENIRDGLQRTIQYQKIIGSAVELKFDCNAQGGEIIYLSEGNDLPVAYQGFDAGLALQVFSSRFVTNQPINPIIANFKHPKPENIQPYEEMFQCELRFSQPHYSLEISNEYLDTPMIFANKTMRDHHEEIVMQAIKDLSNTTLVDQVRDLISKKLSKGEPEIKEFAEFFNVSLRTFQRRLKEENCTFLSLLEGTRKSLAHDYACNKNVSLQEIGFLLGFTDHSNFYRAFKRWYGTTPGEYREQQLP